MKNVYEFMTSKPDEYFQSDFDNCKEFVKLQNCPEKKFSWEDGDESLPEGWKKRISRGEAEMEWILSPEGRMYRSRVIALQDMIQRAKPQHLIEEMRRKLIHDGWQTDVLFPEGGYFV